MSKPIRVLQVVTTMNRGGLETMLMNYYRQMDRSQVQFDFVEHRAERSDYDDEIEALGGKIYRMPTLIPWSRSYHKAWRSFFFEHPEYRLVHVHQDCLSSVILKEVKRSEIPVRIAHSHNSNQDHNLKYLVKMFYRRQIPKYATDLFACGKEAGDWMFQGKPYTIVNNAIPAKQYEYNLKIRERTRREFGLKDEFVVGTVGRFSPQKNHMFLLDVFAKVAELDPNATLLLVGDGGLRSEIESKIKALHLTERVILAGVRKDVPELLQAMDAYVMPSLYEGVSLAIVEAQATGLPCFVSDTIPPECILTEDAKRLSLEDSVENWAKAIMPAKDTVRKDVYSQIAEAGFDIEQNAAWLQDYYKTHWKAGK